MSPPTSPAKSLMGIGAFCRLWQKDSRKFLWAHANFQCEHCPQAKNLGKQRTWLSQKGKLGVRSQKAIDYRPQSSDRSKWPLKPCMATKLGRLQKHGRSPIVWHRYIFNTSLCWIKNKMKSMFIILKIHLDYWSESSIEHVRFWVIASLSSRSWVYSVLWRTQVSRLVCDDIIRWLLHKRRSHRLSVVYV